MLNFTPPPRQQVLYGIRIQAEQARNLVEDLQAGSKSAPNDLLSLASQILARAKMYRWPKLTFWASTLEERLVHLATEQTISSEDVDWLETHVERLDQLMPELPNAPDADSEGSSDELTLDLDGDEPGVEGEIDIALGELDDDTSWLPDAPAEQSPAEATPEEEAPTPEEKAPASEGEAPTPEGEAPTPEEEAPAAEQRQPPSSRRPSSPDRLTPSRQPSSPPGAADENESRATLGRLDIQRRAQTKTLTSTEIQGPNQFIVVSVAPDPEVHRWLGRVLPERRFELLTARGAVEAEMLCRKNQPDLLLLAWEPGSELTQQTLARIRENPLTRYVRVALVPEEESLTCHVATLRLDAVGLIPRSLDEKSFTSKVLLFILSSGQIRSEELGETSMSELSDLLIQELRNELESIGSIVGDVTVPVDGALGQVVRDTSRRLRDGVKLALGSDPVAPLDPDDGEQPVNGSLFQGKRALVMEADRLRRAELARVLGELELEVLPPMPDLTKSLEAGLAWAPDVFIGGSPMRDAETCIRILRHDIALSSMTRVVVRWPDNDRQWPDATADVALLRPWLARQLAEAFAPVAELQRQLRDLDEVTGRVESCGMLALLQLVLASRPRALLEVVEGPDMFKAMIVDGQILDVIWLEPAGDMTAHFDAFARMLAVVSGRFYVRPLQGDLPNPNLPGTLNELLTAACHWWRPLGLTIDQRLMEIKPLTLDKRRSMELKRQTGKLSRKVVSALSKGRTPAEIVNDDGISAAVVAQVLRELVRHFAIREVPI